MAIVLRMDVDCPVCGKTVDKQGLENHMRLTNGMGHGPPGEYPEADDEERRVVDAEEMVVEIPMEPHPDAEGADVAAHDEMSVQEALTLHAEMLFNPEAFGHVSGASHRELEERVGELRRENRELREAVGELTRVVREMARYQGVMREEVGKARGLTSSSDHDGSPLVELDNDRVILE
jgi:hypothetical protein